MFDIDLSKSPSHKKLQFLNMLKNKISTAKDETSRN